MPAQEKKGEQEESIAFHEFEKMFRSMTVLMTEAKERVKVTFLSVSVFYSPNGAIFGFSELTNDVKRAWYGIPRESVSDLCKSVYLTFWSTYDSDRGFDGKKAKNRAEVYKMIPDYKDLSLI